MPFDIIAKIFIKKGSNAIYFKVLGAMKLVRVMRLNKIITYLRSNEQVKALLKLLKLIFFLVLYLHCFGCVWYLMVNAQKMWVPPMNYNDKDYYMVYNQTLAYRYFVSLHTSVMLTTGNDVGPRTTLQVFYGCVGLFAGAIINANMFGELAVLVA